MMAQVRELTCYAGLVVGSHCGRCCSVGFGVGWPIHVLGRDVQRWEGLWLLVFLVARQAWQGQHA